MHLTNYQKSYYISLAKERIFAIDNYLMDFNTNSHNNWLSAIEDELYDVIYLMLKNDWLIQGTDDYFLVLSAYVDLGMTINEKRFRKLAKIQKVLDKKTA
jgi:hypothetical protein